MAGDIANKVGTEVLTAKDLEQIAIQAIMGICEIFDAECRALIDFQL